MGAEHIAEYWTVHAWWHHSIGDQTLFLGMPCFAWSRIVKFFSLLSGLVIFKDIIGDDRLCKIVDKLEAAAKARAATNASYKLASIFSSDSVTAASDNPFNSPAMQTRPPDTAIADDPAPPNVSIINRRIKIGAAVGAVGFSIYSVYTDYCSHKLNIVGDFVILAIAYITFLKIIPAFIAAFFLILSFFEWAANLAIRLAINHVQTRNIGSYWLQSAAILLLLSFVIDLLTS